MFGEGYSPDGLDGPAVSFGDDGLGRKAVLPGDSEQLLSEPESSCRRLRMESSSAPVTNKYDEVSDEEGEHTRMKVNIDMFCAKVFDVHT